MTEQDPGFPQGRTGGDPRPSASSMIAELWSEREQSLPPPPPPQTKGGQSRPPGDRGSSRTGLVAAVVALALLLGGGVGVFMATQGVGLPSTAKYAAKADVVCRPANGMTAAIVKPTSYPDLTTAAGTLVTATDAQMQGLGKLKRPGGTAGGTVGSLLAAMAETNSAGRSLQDAAGRKDDAGTAAATLRLRTSATQASAKAKELAFAACATGMQGGVDTVVGGATAVIKTAFMAKADTLCRALDRSTNAIPPPKSDAKDISRYVNQVLPFADKLIADFKAMPVPPGDEATVTDMIGAMEKVRTNLRDLRDAIVAGDRARFLVLDREGTQLGTALDAKLDAYGLSVCGSNSGNL